LDHIGDLHINDARRLRMAADQVREEEERNQREREAIREHRRRRQRTGGGVRNLYIRTYMLQYDVNERYAIRVADSIEVDRPIFDTDISMIGTYSERYTNALVYFANMYILETEELNSDEIEQLDDVRDEVEKLCDMVHNDDEHFNMVLSQKLIVFLIYRAWDEWRRFSTLEKREYRDIGQFLANIFYPNADIVERERQLRFDIYKSLFKHHGESYWEVITRMYRN